MTSLLPYDEINAFRRLLEEETEVDEHGHRRWKRRDLQEYLEELDELIYTLMLLSYSRGNEIACQELGETIQVDLDQLQAALAKQYDGKDIWDRVSEYFQTEDIDALIRVVETETHRMYNTAIFDAGNSIRLPINKTWATMLDDRVRETHWYLEGVTVPFEEWFYTNDGDSARYPGDFSLAQNNVNCRCELLLTPRQSA